MIVLNIKYISINTSYYNKQINLVYKKNEKVIKMYFRND